MSPQDTIIRIFINDSQYLDLIRSIGGYRIIENDDGQPFELTELSNLENCFRYIAENFGDNDYEAKVILNPDNIICRKCNGYKKLSHFVTCGEDIVETAEDCPECGEV